MTVIFNDNGRSTSVDLGDGEIGEEIDFFNGWAFFSATGEDGNVKDYSIPASDIMHITR